MFEKRFTDDEGSFHIYYMDQAKPKRVDSDKPLYLAWLDDENFPVEVPFVAPIQHVASEEQKASEERMWRDQELRDSDWTQLDDTNPPGGGGVWASYREELRTLPENDGFPSSHVRPEKPVW